MQGNAENLVELVDALQDKGYDVHVRDDGSILLCDVLKEGLKCAFLRSGRVQRIDQDLRNVLPSGWAIDWRGLHILLCQPGFCPEKQWYDARDRERDDIATALEEKGLVVFTNPGSWDFYIHEISPDPEATSAQLWSEERERILKEISYGLPDGWSAEWAGDIICVMYGQDKQWLLAGGKGGE